MSRDTHILKIVNNGRTLNSNQGIKCYPRQTYGLSQEAPQEFKGPHSMMADNGYFYSHDEEGQRNPEEPFSQKKYCSVVGETIDVVGDFQQTYQQGAKDPLTFRRRKGRLTEFMDKNAWMNKVVKLMGFERSEKARQASNRDRQKRICSLSVRHYDNPVSLKPLPKENFTNTALYIEKAKIRTQRYSLLNRKTGDLDFQRSLQVRTPQEQLQHGQLRYLQAESMTNKMASTLQDKEWRSTMSSIRRRHSPTKRGPSPVSTIDPTRQMNFTCDDWSKNTRRIKQVKDQPKDELKQWFNSTCNSRADPWKYRKPRKMETQSSQEINGPEE